jgi:hypothetical protein
VRRPATKLFDLQQDPLEQINLIASDDPQHHAALKKFRAVVDATPDRDARPQYRPRASNPWDRKLRRKRSSAGSPGTFYASNLDICSCGMRAA